MDESIVIESAQFPHITVTVAILIILLTIIGYFIRAKFAAYRNTILIIGLNEAGKTVIFSRLVNEKFTPETYTSMKENVYTCFKTSIGKDLTLVDIPGSERLRKRLLRKYLAERKRSIKGIIFVVDSATFNKKTCDVAEFLYDVFCESEKQIPFLIACNKQDNSLSKTSRAVSAALEREIGLINGTRAAALDSTGGSAKKRLITNTGKKFQWSDLSSYRVDFAECCAIKECSNDQPELDHVPINLRSIHQWINSL